MCSSDLTKQTEITDIANTFNDILDRSEKAGFKTPEAGIGRVGKDLRRISDMLAKKEGEALALKDLETFQKGLDKTLAGGLASKAKLANDEAVLQTTLADMQAEYNAMGAAGRADLRAEALANRIRQTEGALEYMATAKKTLEDFAAKGAELQGLALTEASQLRAKGNVAKRIERLRAQLEGTGEKAVELGGESGAAARAQRGAAEYSDVLETIRMFAHDKGWMNRLREAIDTGLTAEAAVERVQNDNRARRSEEHTLNSSHT